MTIKNLCSVLVLCFMLSLSGVQSHGKLKRQGDALASLYKAKFDGDSGIDTSLFEVSATTTYDATKLDYLDQTKIRATNKGSKEKDRIQRLPGQPPHVGFAHYGGYVTTNETAGRALYYYFAEAKSKSKNSMPLLLWLNGGPGCSSLAYGAMEELGPFRVYSDGKSLYHNKYSWNNVANVLFLESPAGVGFSYSNTTSDYDNSGDKNTAEDNYAFLVNWLERFPEYKKRDFYISGESYAGHYVPQLAHTILHHNKKANKTIINLKGIIIGNAVINDNTDNQGMYDFFINHALVSLETGEQIRKLCNFASGNYSQACLRATDMADGDVAGIDIYNIYGPLCFTNNVTDKPKRPSLFHFDPCSDNYVYAYLNTPEVQEAMHANVTKLDHDWQPCSTVINGWKDSPSTIVPLLQEFMKNGLRVWVISGDVDGRVPVTSSQYSIKYMNLPIKTQWYPWYLNDEVGGYTQEYKGDLTFATVRGAGHEVPSFKPDRALALITHFLAGTPLPNA